MDRLVDRESVNNNKATVSIKKSDFDLELRPFRSTPVTSSSMFIALRNRNLLLDKTYRLAHTVKLNLWRYFYDNYFIPRPSVRNVIKSVILFSTLIVFV